MKKIIKILSCFFLIMGCSDDNNLLEDIAVRGGFVQFVDVPDLNFNILEADSQTISARLVDPNNNITSYSLSAVYDGNVANNIVEITSFPADLNLSVGDILSSLGITNSDLSLSEGITLVAMVTTPTGVFSGETPAYDENNVNQGGDSTVRLKATGLKDAIEFDVTFFLPPAKTIRSTSFEEVAIGPNTDDVYDRNGGNDETGDLINGINPPFVDYTAVGTGADNEIGFNTEYFAIPGISSSSLGFSEERIGVYSLFEDYEAYPDGTQGYHIEDADGGIRITFDTVDVPAGQNNSGISFQAFFGDTSWESEDGIHAFVNITTDSGNDTIDMVDIFDDDVEAVAGVWNEYNTGFLQGVRSYQLVIEASCGATTESFDFDNIVVFEPED
ncbi:hypothetical protein [Flagellimonas sp. S3867]|uniref:hypothetical protein n=1 Tax=Flagellimonas sp. S3867 TaxID=2768063 RepID=UPI0016824F84|nr:hypothetical protein [Flagellimonas sp. S3867]